MSEFKVDFKALKQQIEAGKAQQTTKEVALGRVPEGAIPKKNKKAFLNELVHSMRSGVSTSATEAIRSVNETVEVKRGQPPAVAKNTGGKYALPRQQYTPINENVIQPQIPRTAANDWAIPQFVQVGGGYGNEREDLFEQNLQKQMAAFDQMKMNGNPVAAQIMQQPQYPHQMNEQVVVQQPMTERNMDKLVESAFKNVLTEIYTKQKIQESLHDFLASDEFEKIVSGVILRIAKRNKEKQGK
jgi:hypothetical protein